MKIRSIFIGIVIVSLITGVVFANVKEPSAQELFQQGNQLFLDHDFQAAKEAYLLALDVDSKIQWVHHQLGRVYFSGNELKKALSEFHQEIALHKDSANAFYMRGLTYVFLEDLELG